MKEGDVVITSVVQADGNFKNRPTIILRELPPYQDLLVCAISTQLHHCISGFDEIIAPTDSDFVSSKLVSKSLIRLSLLIAAPQKDVVGVMGKIAPERHKRLLKNLSDYLIKDIKYSVN